MEAIENHWEVISRERAPELVSILDSKIEKLNILRKRMFYRWRVEAVVNLWTCGAFKKLVDLEITALARRRVEILEAQNCDCLMRAFARASWFAWLDGLVAMRLKEQFLEQTNRVQKYRHTVVDKETVELFELKILPLLECGWNFQYERLCRDINEFKVRVRSDSASGVLGDRVDEFIRLPKKETWEQYIAFLEQVGCVPNSA